MSRQTFFDLHIKAKLLVIDILWFSQEVLWIKLFKHKKEETQSIIEELQNRINKYYGDMETFKIQLKAYISEHQYRFDNSVSKGELILMNHELNKRLEENLTRVNDAMKNFEEEKIKQELNVLKSNIPKVITEYLEISDRILNN